MELIDRSDAKLIEEETSAIVMAARSIQIVTQEDATAAGEFLKRCKGLLRRIGDAFGPHVERAYKAHKELVAFQRQAEKPAQEAEATVKSKLSAWTMEQERIRREKEAEAMRIARAKEEDRRMAEIAAMEAEAAKRRAEAEAALAAARAEAAAAKAAGDKARAAEIKREEAARIEREKLEAAQMAAEIAAAEAAPIIVAPPPPVAKATMTEGVSTRQVWKFRIVDADAVPRQFCIPNEQAIGAFVRSMKENAKIAGVEVYSETVIASRGV